jgi:hypothetical protein
MGIIVLGGAINLELSKAYGMPAVEGVPARIVAVANLDARFPQARIVYSGGSDSLTGRAEGEAYYARDLLVTFGIRPSELTSSHNLRAGPRTLPQRRFCSPNRAEVGSW